MISRKIIKRRIIVELFKLNDRIEGEKIKTNQPNKNNNNNEKIKRNVETCIAQNTEVKLRLVRNAGKIMFE